MLKSLQRGAVGALLIAAGEVVVVSGRGQLGVLLAPLGARHRLDGAEGAVEPGLLGGLHFIHGQTQVVLQVLGQETRGRGEGGGGREEREEEEEKTRGTLTLAT